MNSFSNNSDSYDLLAGPYSYKLRMISVQYHIQAVTQKGDLVQFATFSLCVFGTLQIEYL